MKILSLPLKSQKSSKMKNFQHFLFWPFSILIIFIFVIFYFCHFPFLSFSIFVIFYFCHFLFCHFLFWPFSILVIFYFSNFLFWSFSILVIFYFDRYIFWQFSIQKAKIDAPPHPFGCFWHHTLLLLLLFAVKRKLHSHFTISCETYLCTSWRKTLSFW